MKSFNEWRLFLETTDPQIKSMFDQLRAYIGKMFAELLGGMKNTWGQKPEQPDLTKNIVAGLDKAAGSLSPEASSSTKDAFESINYIKSLLNEAISTHGLAPVSQNDETGRQVYSAKSLLDNIQAKIMRAVSTVERAVQDSMLMKKMDSLQGNMDKLGSGIGRGLGQIGGKLKGRIDQTGAELGGKLDQHGKELGDRMTGVEGGVGDLGKKVSDLDQSIQNPPRPFTGEEREGATDALQKIADFYTLTNGYGWKLQHSSGKDISVKPESQAWRQMALALGERKDRIFRFVFDTPELKKRAEEKLTTLWPRAQELIQQLDAVKKDTELSDRAITIRTGPIQKRLDDMKHEIDRIHKYVDHPPAAIEFNLGDYHGALDAINKAEEDLGIKPNHFMASKVRNVAARKVVDAPPHDFHKDEKGPGFALSDLEPKPHL